MRTEAQQEPETGTDIVLLQNGLTQIEATEELVRVAKEDIIVTTIGSLEELEIKKEQYLGITLANLDDISAYDNVSEGIKTLKQFVSDLEKERKRRTDPAVKYQKDLKSQVDAIKDGLSPAIKHLESEKSKFDNAIKARLDKQFTDRIAELTKRAYQLVGGFYVCGVIQVEASQLRTMKDEQFQFYIQEGDKELVRLEAEKKRKEEEAKRKKEEDDRQAAEAKRLADERAEFEREKAEFARQKAELEAQTQGLEKAYDIVVDSPSVNASEPLAPPAPPAMPKFQSPPPPVLGSFRNVMPPPPGQHAPAQHAPAEIPDFEPIERHVFYEDQEQDKWVEDGFRIGKQKMASALINMVTNKEFKVTRQILEAWARAQM